MALGTPVSGSALGPTGTGLLVGLTSTPTTPVGGNVTWTYPMDSPVTTRDYYGQASFVSVGKEAIIMDVTCDYESGDAGQAILFGARLSRATVWLKLLPDGTNGETTPFKVASPSIAGPDVNQFDTASFRLTQFGPPVVVGGGFGT
jgi:hypothetical protein